jgi:hypothetical protein
MIQGQPEQKQKKKQDPISATTTKLGVVILIFYPSYTGGIIRRIMA